MMHTGEAFLTHARRNGLIHQQPSPLLAMMIRPDIEALLLAYKLVSTANLEQGNDAAADTLKVLRVAMAGAFLRQGKDIVQDVARNIRARTGQTVDDSVPLDVRKASFALANARLNSAEVAIKTALDRIRTGSPSPFASFYDDLVGAFGGKGSTEEYEKRYGPILQDLYASLRESIRENAGRAPVH